MSTPENITDPVAVIPTAAEFAIMKAEMIRVAAENAALVAADAKRKEELSYKARIEKEPRFIPARNNLLARRIENPEEIAPAHDVFDFLYVTDEKRKVKNNKRTYVSNLELETYQAMKAAGIKDITYSMIEDSLKKAGHKVVDTVETETDLDVEEKK